MRPRARSLALALLAIGGIAAGQDLLIDGTRSTITVHVGKAGLLSAAGHEHWVSAPISSGTIREGPSASVEFAIQTAKMLVKPDPKVDAKTQAEIQKDMEEMVLETKKFPQIAFHSSHVEKAGDAQWKVDGTLSLHGVSKPVSLTVKRTGDSYSAHAVLKQTDFAMKPITVGGGVIKVKNEVDIDFQIFTQGK
ncbi:MAG TPA: YceI family protein [Bryobacteraceae bacterium]|jgi:polyisoprenoid-binding protein YceI